MISLAILMVLVVAFLLAGTGRVRASHMFVLLAAIVAVSLVLPLLGFRFASGEVSVGLVASAVVCAILGLTLHWIWVRRRARRFLDDFRRIYSKHDYRPLPNAEHGELTKATEALERLGYRKLADFESVRDGKPVARGDTHERAFVGMNGSVTVNLYTRVGSLKKRAPVSANLYTELSDGRWLVTESALGMVSAKLARPPNIERAFLLPVAAVQKLVAEHEARVRRALADASDLQASLVSDFDGYAKKHARYWAEICAFRETLGWITESEIAAMLRSDEIAREIARELERIRR